MVTFPRSSNACRWCLYSGHNPADPIPRRSRLPCPPGEGRQSRRKAAWRDNLTMPLEAGESLVDVPAVAAGFDVFAIIHDVHAEFDLTVDDVARHALMKHVNRGVGDVPPPVSISRFSASGRGKLPRCDTRMRSALSRMTDLHLCLHSVVYRVLVDLLLHHVNVPMRRKGVSAAARDVVGTKMLGRDPQVRRCAIQFPR
jgi:hypothetical protein